jgi:raffinose/stachyose/melibiose transport system substrate-binding protein
MVPATSANKMTIDGGDPAFAYSFVPFPGGTSAGQTRTFLNPTAGLGVNAHSSAASQAAAQELVDFTARPKQDALYAQTTGGLTQYQFLKDDLPPYMSAFTPVFKANEYVVNPARSWWNANVQLALQQDAVGLLTGQETIDDVLNAMDAAWKQGPS